MTKVGTVMPATEDITSERVVLAKLLRHVGIAVVPVSTFVSWCWIELFRWKRCIGCGLRVLVLFSGSSR